MAEVAKIEKTPVNEDVLKNAQPGDMIQFVRGMYSHWAIYVGKKKKITFIFIFYLFR